MITTIPPSKSSYFTHTYFVLSGIVTILINLIQIRPRCIKLQIYIRDTEIKHSGVRLPISFKSLDLVIY